MGAFAGKLFVERDVSAQHAIKNVGGNAPGGEARNVRLWGNSRARHGRRNIATNCVDLAKRQAEKGVDAQLCAGIKVAEKSPDTTQDCACANRLQCRLI